MLKYWINVLKQTNTSLFKGVYLMLKEDVDINCSYNGKHWASQIKHIFQEHDFDYYNQK